MLGQSDIQEIIDRELEEIIITYNTLVKGIDSKAISDGSRAYGGLIRSGKGNLVENIADQLLNLAWFSIGGHKERIKINSKRYRLPISKNYVENIEINAVKKYILDHLEDYTYGISVDREVLIDNKFILGMECKAYTENAMIKRILVDFSLLKSLNPDISCYLLQLESQLGGDFSDLSDPTFGSYSSHTLMSYFPDVDLKIITLLTGERKVDKPIHKPAFLKPLEKEQLINSYKKLSICLMRFL